LFFRHFLTFPADRDSQWLLRFSANWCFCPLLFVTKTDFRFLHTLFPGIFHGVLTAWPVEPSRLEALCQPRLRVMLRSTLPGWVSQSHRPTSRPGRVFVPRWSGEFAPGQSWAVFSCICAVRILPVEPFLVPAVLRSPDSLCPARRPGSLAAISRLALDSQKPVHDFCSGVATSYHAH